MFEKIGVEAEKLATNVSESRRGFVIRIGQAALGVAGVLGGLFGLPSEARAIAGNYCEVVFRYPNGFVTTGYCVAQKPCRRCWAGSSCRPGGYHRGIVGICGDRATVELTCSCG
jgi:hypothetical protein